MELTRREFLKMGCIAAATLALGGCGLPVQQALVSQLDMPEYRLPGESRWFATTCQECGDGCGVSVRIADGRAKKIEGLILHPINHGKVCARGQSALQALYNPDRLLEPMKRQGEQLSAGKWEEITKSIAGQLEASQQKPGTTLWVTKNLRGTTGALITDLAQKTGAKLWVIDYPGTHVERSVMKGLTGKPHLHYLALKEADYVVNFGSDFLGTGHSVVHNNWSYGEFRQGYDRKRGILVSFSSRMNTTAANSDRWIPVRPGWEGWVALGVGNILAGSGKKPWFDWAKSITLEEISKQSGVSVDIMKRLAKKLLEAKRPLIIGGFENSVYTNGVSSLWIIQALNRLLTGHIDSYESGIMVSLPGRDKVSGDIYLSTKDVIKRLENGKFQTVWFLDVNPAYLFPSKLNLEKLFQKVSVKVSFTPYMNETAAICDLVLPTGNWLEEWGDNLVEGPFSENGSKSTSVYGLQQPVVKPRSGSMSISDILLSAVGQTGDGLKKKFAWKSMKDLLSSRMKVGDFEAGLARAGIWEEYSRSWEPYYLEPPMYPPAVLPSKGKRPHGESSWDRINSLKVNGIEEPKFSGEGYVLIPFLSNSLLDGSLANRPWLQELPDPMTSVIWSHWIELNELVAREQGIERGDLVRITSSAGSIEGPAFPSPGIHPEAVAMPVGTGHTNYGRYANHGKNPISILNPSWQDETGELAWVSTRVKLEKIGNKTRLITLDQRPNELHREAIPH